MSSFTTNTKAIDELLAPVQEYFKKLSSREQLLIIVGGIALLLVGCAYVVTDLVTPLFASQKQELTQVDLQASELPGLIRRHQNLVVKKQRLEEEFKANNADLDEPSYVESIVKKHTKIDTNSLRIAPSGKPVELGADFEQEAYTVNFRTGEMKDVVDFLERTANGPQPLLITRIEVRRSGTQLTAAVTLSSIRRKRGVS